MDLSLSVEKQNALLNLMNEFLKEDSLLDYFEFSQVPTIIGFLTNEKTVENSLKLILALLKDREMREELIDQGICEKLANLFLQLDKFPEIQLFIIIVTIYSNFPLVFWPF